MIHEGLKGDVIGEDGLSRLGDTTIGSRGVSRGRVQLREQEPCLRSTGITYDESR